jgi:hypothetical protein
MLRILGQGSLRAGGNTAPIVAARHGLARMSSISGPEVPSAVDGSKARQIPWNAGWHDHLQYHFFFDGLFVQARMFRTPSLDEASLWIFDHTEGRVKELLNAATLRQQGSNELDVSGDGLHIVDGEGGGSLNFSPADMNISFKNRLVFSWLPAGQEASKDAVIHRPNLDLTITYNGQTLHGHGYSKRYYGKYGPHWGYRFIQSSWLGNDKFLWTADATFRLGDGEAKYNYFKLLDGSSGSLVQADSKDTYQQDNTGYALIGNTRYEATVTPLGEWMHDYKAGDTNSRMQLRYCKLRVSQGDDVEPLEGYALNERCFGVL